MASDDPISFYVPARNAEQHLPACIAAIRSQTRPPDELFIVVDPRSQDRTVEVARQLGVTVLEQTGTTLGAARNNAIQAARHRWLASCDSDVFLQPDWLEHIAARRPESVAGIGGRSLENARTPFDEWRALLMPHHWGDYPLRNPFMLVSEVMFDREALLAVGGYRDDLNYYEDSDLCQRLRDAGYELLYEPSAVAYHQRSDTLVSLLDLRWKYSEYRQKHLLDRYSDLLRKLAINREYAVSTLSKLLAHGREDLTYISFLLYFHHLLRDVRSLHSRRPLLTNEQPGCAAAVLSSAVSATVKPQSELLASAIALDLPFDRGPTRGDAASVQWFPAWPAFIDGVRRAVEAFCVELTAPVLRIVESSAQYLRGETGRDAVQRLTRLAIDDTQKALDGLGLRSVATAELVETIRRTWPDTAGINVAGRLNPDELVGLGRAAEATASTGLILHLEAHPDPLSLLASMRPRFRRLVVCYQPPSRFIPGLDVLSASDLASAAVAAGWTIHRFETLVGRTQLMLSRTESPR